MKLKLFFWNCFLFILLFSCSEEQEKRQVVTIEERLAYTKAGIEETEITYNDIRMGGNRSFDAHMDRIQSMLRRIEFTLKFEESDLVDVSKEYRFFHHQKEYNANFFRARKLPIEEALFVIDQLLVNLRNSKLGNNFYRYSYPEFHFEESYGGDSLDFTISPVQMIRKGAFLGSVKYCRNFKKAADKSVFLENQKLDISTFNSGDTITGGILMEKMNNLEFVPFTYVKK